MTTPPVDQQTRIDERIDQLAALQAGWWDGSGEPITAPVLAAARTLAYQLTDVTVRIYPTEDGGVTLEWSDGPHLIALEITANLRAEAMAVDADGTGGIQHWDWEQIDERAILDAVRAPQT